MKKTLFFALLISLTAPAFAQSVPVAANLALREKNKNTIYPISVEYPAEKTKYKDTKNIFIFGSVFNPNAKLKINGLQTPVYKTGGWLAYIPLTEGENEILLEAEVDGQTYQSARRVSMSTTACMEPQKEIYAIAGDVIDLKLCAPAGQKITAAIKGVKKNIDMAESTPGVYKAAYTISEKDSAKAAKITYEINDEEKLSPPGTLKILKKDSLPLVGEVTDAPSRIRTAAVSAGYLYPFHKLYDRVLIDGKKNGLYRVMLDGANRGWVEESKIKILNEKNFNINQISLVEITYDEEKTKIVFFSSKKTPFTITDKDLSFDITFFYTNLFEEKYIFSAGGPIVADAGHEFLSPQTINFVFAKKRGAALWGYDQSYDESGNLVLYLFHKAAFDKGTPQSPLEGIKVFLDPGHSPRRTAPYDGAIGPTGVLEYEANMMVALELAELLKSAGATVILSKNEKETASLTARVERALEAKADIFVSIHQNALPDGTNPFGRKRGMAVYYFNEHSKKLASSVNKKMAAKIPSLYNNGIIVGDLFVVRMPQMPAILTENLFMMFPEQEALIKDSKERQKFAEGIYEGILDFFGKQKPAAKKPAPKKSLRAK